MTKLLPPISSLLIAMVGCWLMVSSTEGTHFPFYYYSSSPYLNADLTADTVPVLITNYDSAGLNRPISFSSVPPGYITDDPTAINGRTFQAFANIFAGRGPFCRPCPAMTCPPAVTCPTCKTCPAVPVIPAQTITLAPAKGECFSTTVLNTASIAPCSRVSAAPKGTINVIFSDEGNLQTVTIGIVAVTPNTQIKLTCTVIPSGGDAVAKTQVGAITVNKEITSYGFLQIIASGAGSPSSAIELTCSWESS